MRAIGLSEAGPKTIQRAHAVHPIAALQTEEGDDLVPLVGMGRPENVERNLEAFRVTLDDADVAALDAAFPIGCAAGLRYPESMTSSLGREAPPAGG